jgi:hypothetical protein
MSELNGPGLLRECLARLEWNPERLAREIGRTCGYYAVSPKAPYHWLNGAAPRGALPEIAALTLSRALGEHVDAVRLWPGTRARTLAVSAHSGMDFAWTADGARCCAELICRPIGKMLLPVSGPLAVAPVVDWFTAPAAVATPSGQRGELISPEILAVLAERVGQLRRLDDAQSGRMLLDWIKQDLRWAASLACTGSYDRESCTALFQVLAELAQLAGWVATDLGQYALGQRYLLAALHFAHAAGDAELAAAIVSCLSYLALWMKSPGGAIRMIKMARQRVAGHASAVTAALLASREARAHAVGGDAAACAGALDETTALFEARAVSPVAPPAWAYWVTEAVLAGDAGRAWLEAGFPGRAAPLLEAGLELFGDSQPRNRLLHGVSLAQCRLLTRQIDGAVHAANQALDLVGPQDSARARSRLAELGDRLAASRASAAIAAAGRINDLIHA